MSYDSQNCSVCCKDPVSWPQKEMIRELKHLPLMLKSVYKVFDAMPQCRHWFPVCAVKQELSSSVEAEKAVPPLRNPRRRGSSSIDRNPPRRRGSSSIDSHMLLRLLRAHSKTWSRMRGLQIHALVITLGFESVVFLQTALMSMYAATGRTNDARHVFDESPHRTVVCWTAMMSVYINNKRPDKVLELFREMQIGNMEPDNVTITTALSACADLGALDIGEWIHTYICRRQQKQGFGKDLILTNALINMYAKCGDNESARQLFELASRRDVTTWTSMIMGHAMNGQAEEALSLFSEMKRDGHSISPNSITFIGVLMACSHAGLVEVGRQHWESMQRDHSLKPRIAHYGCMVDLLCRAGRLAEAHHFIKAMPMRPNAVIWRILLSACTLHGDVDLGAIARHNLLELEPGYAGDDVAMSNAYAAAGMWEEKQGVRRRMKLRRAPGCSLIEMEGQVHEFAAGDRRHVNNSKIREVLLGMACNSKALVFPPEASDIAIGSDEPN